MRERIPPARAFNDKSANYRYGDCSRTESQSDIRKGGGIRMGQVMNLTARVHEALGSVAPFQQGAHLLQCEADGSSVRCSLAALDVLACALDTLEVTVAALAEAPLARLSLAADAVSRRLTYLLEPIGPVEVDSNQCVVQLRSIPPQKDDNGSYYYELLVRGGGRLSLCRYAKEPGALRRRIPAQVTREVFLRLVTDLASAGK